jgi:hypothetical protein
VTVDRIDDLLSKATNPVSSDEVGAIRARATRPGGSFGSAKGL